MTRYIDADNMKSIKNIQSANFNSIESIREWIDAQPTADVVEVVRCKDCKYYNTYENHEKINDGDKLYDGWCMRWNGQGYLTELVRCKDCKHHDEDYYTENGVCLIQFDCDGSRLIVTDNHYCGFGVKS